MCKTLCQSLSEQAEIHHKPLPGGSPYSSHMYTKAWVCSRPWCWVIKCSCHLDSNSKNYSILCWMIQLPSATFTVDTYKPIWCWRKRNMSLQKGVVWTQTDALTFRHRPGLSILYGSVQKFTLLQIKRPLLSNMLWSFLEYCCWCDGSNTLQYQITHIY